MNRRVLFRLAKAVLGLALLGVILWKLPVRDRLTLSSGSELSGRHLRLSPPEGRMEVRDFSGQVHSFPWRGGPELVEQSGKVVVHLRNGTSIAAQSFNFVGDVELSVDGDPVHMSLADVAVRRVPLADESGMRLELELSQGLESILLRLNGWSVAMGTLLMLSSFFLGSVRWQRLLRVQAVTIGGLEAIRLTFIGLFFNNVVPGSTGGDVAKGWILAKQRPGKGPAIFSAVLVDRILGLFVLAGIAALVMLAALDRYASLALVLWGMLAAAGVLAALVLSRRVRKSLGLDNLYRRLPAAASLQALDHALLAYRGQTRVFAHAVVLSVLAQAAFVGGIVVFGLGLGLDESAGLAAPAVLSYVMTLPPVLIVSAVPLLPGGWGVGEAAYGYFFALVGVADFTLPVALSVLGRGVLLVMSLWGGVLVLRTGLRAARPDGSAQ
jgi:uncharacterized protein (TIRG00374 family)